MPASKGNPANRIIVRLGAAACEDDFTGLAMQQRSYLLTRRFNCLVRLP